MKVKSKLWLSYFSFALLFSISIFWLLVELKGFSSSVSGYIQSDITALTGVSEQLQKLEDVYSLYLTLFIPSGRPGYTKYSQVNKARTKFSDDWENLKKKVKKPVHYSTFNKIIDQTYHIIHQKKVSSTEKDEYNKKTKIEREIDKEWAAINSYIIKSISSLKNNRPSDAEYIRKTHIIPQVKKIRANLSALLKIYSKRSQRKSKEILDYTALTYKLIPYFLVTLIILLFVVALIFSNRITKPLASLKDAIDQVAVQDYNISIKDKSNDEIGELSTAFEQLAERLKDSEKYKTSMLSQFTHEMKDPIGATIQATRLLLKSPDTSKQQSRFLKIIENNSERLRKLINNILHSATYDRETIKLDYSLADIVDVLKKVIIALSLNAKEKNIKIVYGWVPDKIVCEIDSDKMEEVFQNLISNAIKFSKEGSTIKIALKSSGVSTVEFAIQDQGIGIPKKETPYIFEKMYRASNSKKISVKGTGLGLYITSHIIRAHGGKITVNSTLGKGTEFRVKLPRNRKIAEEGGWFDA